MVVLVLVLAKFEAYYGPSGAYKWALRLIKSRLLGGSVL